MPFSVIATGGAVSGNGTSVTTGPIDCVGADLIIVAVASYAITVPLASYLTDSQGNTYTSVISETSPGAPSPVYSTLFACGSPSVGSAMTFSFAYGGGSTFPAIAILALSGGSGYAIDQTNFGIANGGSTVNTGNITPTQNNEIWVTSAVALQELSSTPTAANGTVAYANVGNPGVSFDIGMSYSIQTAAITASETWTMIAPGGAEMVAVIASFIGGTGAVNVRVNQSCIELIALENPNVRVNQSCVEFLTLPAIPPVPPIVANFPQPAGAGPPSILCPRRINLYDLCALGEKRRMKRICVERPCNIPTNLLAWEDDGYPTPPGAVPFNILNAIPTPLPAAGDVLVCSGKVPLGYDGLLTEIFQIFQGSGFQQGSGDIVWRIRRNQVWLKGLGSCLYSLGNTLNPITLTEGQILFSGTQFGFYVNVPNVTSSLIIAGSSIACGMRGFYWPRG